MIIEELKWQNEFYGARNLFTYMKKCLAFWAANNAIRALDNLTGEQKNVMKISHILITKSSRFLTTTNCICWSLFNIVPVNWRVNISTIFVFVYVLYPLTHTHRGHLISCTWHFAEKPFKLLNKCFHKTKLARELFLLLLLLLALFCRSIKWTVCTDD